jgi:hypothetical protein
VTPASPKAAFLDMGRALALLALEMRATGHPVASIMCERLRAEGLTRVEWARLSDAELEARIQRIFAEAAPELEEARRMIAEQADRTRICVECGAQIAGGPRRLYCDSACRDAYYRRTQPDYIAKRRDVERRSYERRRAAAAAEQAG